MNIVIVIVVKLCILLFAQICKWYIDSKEKDTEMENTIIRADRDLREAKKNKNFFSRLLDMLKERASPRFFILVATYVTISLLQASGILPIRIRAVLGIVEIGLSIFLSYHFGYLAMFFCIVFNSLAAVNLFIKSNEITAIAIRDASNLSGKFTDVKNISFSAGGLLISLSANRIALIVACIMVAHITEGVNRKIKKLEFLANIDGVTGVFNHRYFQTRIEEEIQRANETNSTLGMIMIDLDNFKKYNDNFGHKAGDILLSKTSEIFMNEKEKQDIVFRYGGDEFAILLPEACSGRILSVIERIRNAFDEMYGLEEVFTLPDKVTLSAGYSIYPDLARNKDELIMQSDSALYQAKNMGRNNVQLYRDIFEDIKVIFDSDEKLFIGLRALLGTVSAKDKYTLGHSERVMDYAEMIGREMRLDMEKIRLLKIAALLHDIGKVEIPESVLNKNEPLTEEDIKMLQRHPDYSADILEPLSGIELLIDSIKHHHERFDGTGYPSGISGDEIPIEARILCVADSFDAMLSDRPYRKGMRFEEVITELKENAGTQFDPFIIEVFLSALSVKSPA